MLLLQRMTTPSRLHLTHLIPHVASISSLIILRLCYIYPITALEDMRSSINQMKENKAAGLDYMRAEQIKNFGPRTVEWLVQMMNCCVRTLQIPKIWRKARVVALLKPGKDPTDARSLTPVSLFCHPF